MYITRPTKKQGNKSYSYPLLVESYRDHGVVKRRILQNLSRWKPEDVDNLESALKASREGKQIIGVSEENVTSKTDKAVGGIYAAKRLMDRLKVTSALGDGEQARLVMLMTAARLIHPSSKLANVRWAEHQDVEGVLGMDSSSLSEDKLYSALDWLESNQFKIERSMFKKRHSCGELPSLFLYDVTSSYLEGEKNEFADWGYNRVKKKGKNQIVIGLLCDSEGEPVAVRVFEGNCSDPATVPEQIRTVVSEFGAKSVTFVGDKGMLKAPQIKALHENGFHYITSLAKSSIRKLLSEGVLQISLFDEKIVEVEAEGVRYILRCNPQRRADVRKNRNERICKVSDFIVVQNKYLALSSRRSIDVSLRKTRELIAKYKLSKILFARVSEVGIRLETNKDALSEAELLDGCYVIKTDLAKEDLNAEKIHDRYKDLSVVEYAFRTIKSELEIRPVNHRLAGRTRAHVFLCMLAYRVQREFERMTAGIDGTLADKWYALNHLMSVFIRVDDFTIRKCAEPTMIVKNILAALKLPLPRLSKGKRCM